MIADREHPEVDRKVLLAGGQIGAAIAVAGDLVDNLRRAAVQAVEHLAEFVGLIIGLLGQRVEEGQSHFHLSVQREAALPCARHVEDIGIVAAAENDGNVAACPVAAGIAWVGGAAEGTGDIGEALGAGSRAIEVGVNQNDRRPWWRRIVVLNDSVGSTGDDLAAFRRIDQVDGKVLIRLDVAVAGNVDGDHLAGLSAGEADRLARKGAADEVVRRGRVRPAAADHEVDRVAAGNITGAGDGKGEGGRPRVTLGLLGVGGSDGEEGLWWGRWRR